MEHWGFRRNEATYRLLLLSPVQPNTTRMRHIQDWTITNGTVKTTFYLDKVSAFLQNRTIKMASLEQPPYVVLNRTSTGETKPDGTFLKLMDYLQNIYNFSVEYTILENVTTMGTWLSDYNWTGCLGMVNHRVWLTILISLPIMSIVLWVVARSSPAHAQLDPRTREAGLVKFFNCVWYLYGALLQQGYAERRGLCSEGSRVALVEDAPHSYSLTRIIAHELGHTLGATHDGVESERNHCSRDDGYIMAPFTHGSNNGHFSDCSIKEIQEFVKTIKEDCREVKSRNTLNKNGTPVLPGVVMNLTRYCELKHPSFCDITVNQDKIKECQFQCCFGGRVKCMKNKPADPTSCNNQWDINMDPLCSFKCCSLFASDATHKCFEEIAVDGTPCDDKKMCFRNKCADNYDPFETPGLSTAPATEESKSKDR
ncbi:venom metalloproteinase antarease-like TtrivMP_A [Ixodes scapularis]